MTGWHLFGIWLAVINVIAFATYGWDKRAARLGNRRVSEAHLLWLAFLFGAPGAWLGMRVFRHKTIKTGFRVRFLLVTLLEVTLIGAALWWIYLREPAG